VFSTEPTIYFLSLFIKEILATDMSSLFTNEGLASGFLGLVISYLW
jgi:hypothetical protein